MNCLLETVASLWIMSLRAAGTRPPQDDEVCIQESLEGCRATLESREANLDETCKKLSREALKKRQLGDVTGAKSKLLERRRAAKRLEKLRSSLSLVDAQLDALRTTELDREVMQTLLASSAALKKAGVGKGVKEAEEVMSELDEQMRESSELTSVLSGPLLEEDLDLEAELELLGNDFEVEALGRTLPSKAVLPPQVNRQEFKDFIQPEEHRRQALEN